jgi:pimeloyl-ACP methyl ester carboxylesterase
MATPKISRFRSAEHQATFDAAYDRALAACPPGTTTSDVSTTYGTTCVHGWGTSSADDPPIVLLHGVAVASPSWFGVIGALSSMDRWVLAIDTITDAGRSRGSRPVADAEALAGWLHEVLAEIAPRGAHLVGLSFGAWLALNQSVRRPDDVVSAVIVDPPLAFGLPPMSKGASMIPDAIRAKLQQGDAPVHRLLARMNGGVHPDQPVLDLSVRGLRSFHLVQPRPKRFSADQLRSIRVPVLVMVGDRSPVNVPRRVEQAASAIPDVVVEVVRGAGHAIPMDAPEEFARRVMEFIDATSPAAS